MFKFIIPAVILSALVVISSQAQQPPVFGQQIIHQTFRTYSAAAGGITPFATPTDLCAIEGNATTTVRVTRVTLTSTQTTAGVNTYYLLKRSTLDGGIGTPMTVVPHDSSFGAASAKPIAWPSPGPSSSPQPSPTGTAIGSIQAFHLTSPAPAGTTGQPYTAFWDADMTSSPVVLHATEMLAVNFNGAALPAGLTLNCSFEWTEF